MALSSNIHGSHVKHMESARTMHCYPIYCSHSSSGRCRNSFSNLTVIVVLSPYHRSIQRSHTYSSKPISSHPTHTPIHYNSHVERNEHHHGSIRLYQYFAQLPARFLYPFLSALPTHVRFSTQRGTALSRTAWLCRSPVSAMLPKLREELDHVQAYVD